MWFDGCYRRKVRQAGVVHELVVHGVRCPRCRAGHAVLPDFVVARRLDTAEVIGTAVAAAAGAPGAACGTALLAGVPARTIRSWRARFAAISMPLAIGFSALAAGRGWQPVDLPCATPAHTAMAAIGAAWHTTLTPCPRLAAALAVAVRERHVRRRADGYPHKRAAAPATWALRQIPAALTAAAGQLAAPGRNPRRPCRANLASRAGSSPRNSRPWVQRHRALPLHQQGLLPNHVQTTRPTTAVGSTGVRLGSAMPVYRSSIEIGAPLFCGAVSGTELVMADVMVGLAAAIGALRQELLAAMAEGKDAAMRFRLAPVELSMQVAVTKEAGGRSPGMCSVLAGRTPRRRHRR